MGPLIQSCGWHSGNLRFTLWEFRSLEVLFLRSLIMDLGPLIRTDGRIVPDVPADFPGSPQQRFAYMDTPVPSQYSVMQEYIRILIRRRWVALAGLVVIFGVFAINSLRSTRIYEASGSIAIAKTEPTFSLQGSQNPADYYDTSDLDTEAMILRSDLLALQVIHQLGFDKLPSFGGRPVSSSGPFSETTDDLQSDPTRTSHLLANFRGNLKVALVPNTRVIEIHFRSPDPELASKVVNTLMRTYVEQNFKTKYANTMQASDWLQQQLDELLIKVQTSQEKLVNYQKEHQILGIDEKQNIITAKLNELNQELTLAQADRMAREAAYQLVQSQDSDTAAAAFTTSGSPAAGGQSDSGLLDKLREQQANLKIQVAQLSTQFGSGYPKVAELNNQLKETDVQIQIEMKKVVGRVRGDYEASLNRENMLSAALEKQKDEANKLNESSITYSLLKRDMDTNRTLYEGLLEKLKEAGVSASLKSTNFRTVDVARVPTAPSEPNIRKDLTTGLGLGFAGGIVLAFLFESLDNTVRTPEQAHLISGLASLGMIPMGSRSVKLSGAKRHLSIDSSQEAVELIAQSRPQSQMSEAYRALRTSLLLSSIGAPPKVIVMTSALPQEGKTTTSINTAIVLAQKGSRVLLVDGDLRRPSIHKALGIPPRGGLSNLLTGSVSLRQAVISSQLLPTLFVLPAGTPPPNPAELLASANMRDMLAELRQQYDHIVIDSPPTLSVTDAVILSTYADTVVLVIRSGQTTKHALRRARDLLARVNARLSGVLLNAADLSSPEYYYYYGHGGKYGSRYYEQAEEERELADSKDLVPPETSRAKANSSSA